MTTTTLLLPLSSPDHASAMVNQIADAFADQDVHLIGLHVRPYIFSGSAAVSRASYGMYFSQDIINDHLQRIENDAQAVEDAFNGPKLAPNILREFRSPKGEPLDEIIRQSLYADVLVLPLLDIDEEDDEHRIKSSMTNYLLHNSSTPVLLLPMTGSLKPVFSRPLMAWKESSEAGSALRTLMLLAPDGAHVDVVTAQKRFTGAKMGNVSLVDLASYVARHGYKVEDHTLVAPSDQVAQAICSKAADVGSTLIVAGAYSRQRWIEQLFGGVTQSLFLQTRHPVLFAR